MILIFLMCLNITLIIISWIYGYRVQQQLSNFQTLAQTSKSLPHSPVTSTRNVVQTTNPPNTNRQSFRRKEGTAPNHKTVSTIFKLLVAMTILTALAVAYEAITLLNALSTRYDYYDHPQDVPEFTFVALLQQSLFPLAQEAVVLVSLYFFRRLPSRSTSNQNSAPDQLKELENHLNGPIQPINGVHKSPPPLPPDTPYHLSRMLDMNVTSTILTPTLPTAQLETHIDIDTEGC